MKTALLALVLIAGCGRVDLYEGTASPVDETDWVAQPIGTCGSGRAFHDGMYTAFHGCALGSGAFGLSTETGYYVAEGDTLRTYPTHATCRAEASSVEARFAFSNNADRLTLTTQSGPTVLYRSNPRSLANTVAGCFDASGTFAPSPLARL